MLPTITPKEFALNNFFAKFYACQPGKKADGNIKSKLSYSEAFIKNFDDKMWNNKGYFEYPTDFKFEHLGILSGGNDF